MSKILVIGDFMLDHSIYTENHKFANEQPIPVLKVNREKYSLGGAGNVVKNLHALGCNVTAVGTIGQDQYAEIMKRKLTKICTFLYKEVQKTTVKHRVYTGNYLQCRYDSEMNQSPNGLHNILDNIISTSFDLVFLCDYAKGVLTKELFEKIWRHYCSNNVPTVVDPKNSFYKGLTVLKPNLSEASLLLGYSVDMTNLSRAHSDLQRIYQCQYSVITLSEHGISCGHQGQLDIVPISNPYTVCDVTGAGDVVSAMLCSRLAAKLPLDIQFLQEVVNIATKSVQFLGTFCLSPLDFKFQIDEVELALLRRVANSRKQTLVFTNGCFDLLHAGHISSLRFAAAQGNILVAGLNSDQSVATLKPGRPIQNQDARLEALKSLGFIHHVIIFNSETPTNILRQLKPDIMVKGAEYAAKPIVGCVHAKKVVLAPMLLGVSTTQRLEELRSTLK